jgi:hypothetical protein
MIAAMFIERKERSFYKENLVESEQGIGDGYTPTKLTGGVILLQPRVPVFRVDGLGRR